MIYVHPDSFNLSSTDGRSHDFLFFDTTNHTVINIIVRISLRFDVFILRDIEIFSHSCGTNGEEYICVKRLHFYE